MSKKHSSTAGLYLDKRSCFEIMRLTDDRYTETSRQIRFNIPNDGFSGVIPTDFTEPFQYFKDNTINHERTYND